MSENPVLEPVRGRRRAFSCIHQCFRMRCNDFRWEEVSSSTKKQN